MVTVSLRFDEETKRQLDEMCEEMGMNITTFFMIYAKRALRDRKIPFDIVASSKREISKVYERQFSDKGISDEFFSKYTIPTQRGQRTDEYIRELRENDRC